MMNRFDEYRNLQSELEQVPSSLEYTIQRAHARLKKNRRFRWAFAVPAGSITAFMAVFVILINSSFAFASACGRVPLLRDLAAAVAFSPSLSAAIDNQFVQPIGLEQSENGIIMRIEYVIVDQKQLNVFYTLDSQLFDGLGIAPEMRAKDGTPLQGGIIAYGNLSTERERLKQITFDFTEENMPSEMQIICRIYETGSGTKTEAMPVRDTMSSEPQEYTEPEIIATFDFLIRFDPSFTAHGEIYPLHHDFVLNGQTLTATSVDIYPTHLRLNLKDHEWNTAWLKSLDFYLVNEDGKRFEKISNGVTATGSVDSPMMASYRLESSFFTVSKHLTIYIEGATWLDKDMERIHVDLNAKRAIALPEGVTFDEAKKVGNNWHLTFSAPKHEEHAMYQLFDSNYFDETGKEYHYNSWSSTEGGDWDEETQTYQYSDRFEITFALQDYPYDVVYLSPSYSRIEVLIDPITIKIK